MTNLGLVLTISYAFITFTIFLKVIKRDLYYALFLIFIFIYSFFSILTYLIYPEFIAFFSNLYWGNDSIYTATIFSILSMLSCYIFFLLIYLPLSRNGPKTNLSKNYQSYFFLISGFFTLILYFLSFVLSDSLNYELALETSNILKIFVIIYDYSSYLILTFYISLRQKLFKGNNKAISQFILITIIIIFLLDSIAMGRRTSLLNIFLGISFFEIFANKNIYKIDLIYIIRNFIRKLKIKTKRFYKFSLFTLISLTITVLIWGLLFTRGERSSYFNFVDVNSPLIEFIFLNDFTFPFLALPTAIHHNFIDPFAVLSSNFFNSLIQFNYPFLQQILVDSFQYQRNFTRGASTGFFIFTEGFVFLGMWGFLYNGIMSTLIFGLFRKVSKTNNVLFNQFASSLIFSITAGIIRVQSSTILKTTWLFLLPTFVLYSLISGIRLSYKLEK